jgi:uncharacterized protein
MMLAASPPRVHLLVVQPTPFCNINCSYCYLAERSDRGKISEATMENLFSKLFASGWVQRKLDLAWHAGEPTVLPIEFYRRAFEIVERHRPRDVELRHGLQTNATLLNDAWCDFFRNERVSVGVSIDGPQRLNDVNRVSRSGRSTYAKVIAGIRLLRAAHIPFHVITVLSAEGMRSARELYDFYASEGIENVAFNTEESEGEHVSSLGSGPAAWEAFKEFLAEFSAIAARDGRVKLIRELENGYRSVYQNPRFAPAGTRPLGSKNIVVEPFGILSVDYRGNMATFSPELLGNKNKDYNDYIIGNVNTDEFASLPENPVLKRLHADIAAGVEMCREQCAYFDMCGGGQPSNKIAENGTFVSSVTTFCRMTRMAVTDLVMNGPHAG